MTETHESPSATTATPAPSPLAPASEAAKSATPLNDDAAGAALRRQGMEIDRAQGRDRSATESPEGKSPLEKEASNDLSNEGESAAENQAPAPETKSIPQQTRTDQQNNLRGEKFVKAWVKNWEALAADYPELNNKQSPLQKKVLELFETPDPELKRFLTSTPKGPQYAVQLARQELGLDKTSQLSKENADLKAKLKERDRKLAPSAGVAVTSGGTKSFEQMNRSEQGNYLRRRAMEEDGMI